MDIADEEEEGVRLPSFNWKGGVSDAPASETDPVPARTTSPILQQLIGDITGKRYSTTRFNSITQLLNYLI